MAKRGADAPPALLRRVRGVLEANREWGGSLSVAEALLKAGEGLLGAVVADSTARRDVALDLLAADACVTWAFEVAADEPVGLPARAERAMEQIAGFAQ